MVKSRLNRCNHGRCNSRWQGKKNRLLIKRPDLVAICFDYFARGTRKTRNIYIARILTRGRQRDENYKYYNIT